jgi:transposase InsO family protein
MPIFSVALHLSVTAHARVTGPIVRDTFRQTVAGHGVRPPLSPTTAWSPATRLAGGRGGRNAFEHDLRRLRVRQKNSTPNHATTCGKVERFQQTMKNWLRAQPGQPTTLAGLQTLLNRFCDAYNHHRPHRSLPRRATPAAVYTASPKALPDGSRDADTHARPSATTASTPPEWSPCASTAGSTTSASDEPTPEPTSSC